MSVWNSVRQLGERMRLSVLISGGHPMDPAVASWWPNVNTSAGVAVTEDTAMQISAFYAGVNFWGEAMGSLPLHVHRKLPDGGSDPVPTHPAQYLLQHEASPVSTAKLFRKQLEIHKLIWGNAYAEIVWDGRGAPAYFKCLEPWRVRPFMVEGEYRLAYEITDASGSKRTLPSTDMLHIPGLGDGIIGKSVLTYARESLGLALAMQQHSSDFFGKGAVPSGVLEHPAVLKPEARKNLREEWEEVHSGTSRVAVLWEGMKYTPMTMPSKDAELLASRQFSVAEIARWLNLPPHILRDLTRSTNNNIEHQGIELVTHSLGPECETFEQEYDRKLLNPPNLYCKHNVDGLLRGDAAARGELYNVMINAGLAKRNEIRALEELNPVEGGDELFVPANMVPLKFALEKPKEPEPVAVAAPQENADDKLAALSADLQELLRSQLTRSLKIEASAARKAAKHPGRFVAWIDEFYGEHEHYVLKAALPVCRCLSHLSETDAHGEAKRIAKEHVESRRAELLTLSECQPEELPERIEAATAEWETRLVA